MQIADTETPVTKIGHEEIATGEVLPTDNEIHGSEVADGVRDGPMSPHDDDDDVDDEDDVPPCIHGAPHLQGDGSQQSDDDEDPFELERTVPFAKSVQQSDEEEYEKHNISNPGTDDTPNDDELPTTPHNEQNDTSDSISPKKHSSSIYTGVTEDRWSYDGSSLTTPTSDRAGSPMGSPIEGTPKKPLDCGSKLNQGPETVQVEEQQQQQEASAVVSGGITSTVEVR